MDEKHYLVPPHNEGAETDIVYSLVTETVEDADDLFVDAKDRLLDISNWAKYGNIPSVSFRLADSHKHRVSRHARRGDHIHINDSGEMQNPLPGVIDWLTIDALEYDDYPDNNLETFAIRMHPSAADTAADTSTIVIERSGKKLSAIYHGRNNVSIADNGWHGLQDSQWAALMKGLLEYF